MATVLQFRRGSTAAVNQVTGKQGELFIDLDKKTVVVQDGITQGGFPLQRELQSSVNVKTINGVSIVGPGNIIPNQLGAVTSTNQTVNHVVLLEEGQYQQLLNSNQIDPKTLYLEY